MDDEQHEDHLRRGNLPGRPLDPASPLVGSQPFEQPFFVALTQALGVGSNEFGPATTPLPATTEVDYVHVWK